MERFPTWRSVLDETVNDDIAIRVQRWKLDPIEHADPHALLSGPDDAVGRFFLALAVAYNDLKGAVLFEQYLLGYGRPAPGDFSEHGGQWRGTMTHLHRWIGGCLYELMILLDEDDSKAALASTEIRELLAVMPPKRRDAWADLVDAAQNKHTSKRSPLLLIRNTTGFHYDQKTLAKGYRAQFDREAKANPSAANRTAQFSLGDTMQGTRFYYADAAAQRAFLDVGLKPKAKPYGNADDGIIEIAGEVNEAVGPLLQTFVMHRAAKGPRGPAL